VHGRDGVGTGQHQVFVAALEVRPAEVVGPEVQRLHVGAEGTIEDDDALPDRVEKGLPGHDR
jgi:hypothetical protein